MNRRVWPILAATVLGCAILAGLGFWQLQRLQWKEGLLAELERRGAVEPVSLSASLTMDDIEYLHVAASGTFLPGELQMLTSLDGQPGWQIVQILRSDDGIAALVDRGVVPDSLRDPARREPLPDKAGLTAVASRHAAKPGLFVPDNDPRGNIWYSWDIPAMLAAADVPADGRVAPFILHALEAAPGREFPRPVPLQSRLVNNHLNYALTWFALSVVLAVMSALFIRQQVKRTAR